MTMPSYQLPQVNSTLWAASLYEPGKVVQGIDVILQRFYIAINTPVGADPLRPFFGCDLYDHIDKDVQIAAPKIKKSILDTVSSWVQGMTISNITYTSSVTGGITYSITPVINGELLTSPIGININNSQLTFIDSTASLIIDSDMPLNAAAMAVALTLNGRAILTPTQPVDGFEDAGTMLTWVQANWAAYGKWTMSKDYLILYAGSEYKTGKISITAV